MRRMPLTSNRRFSAGQKQARNREYLEKGEEETVMSGMVKPVSAAVGAMLAVVAIPLVMAGSASATPYQCRQYMTVRGFVVGPKVTQACNDGGVGGPHAFVVCWTQISGLGVNANDAQEACHQAGE